MPRKRGKQNSQPNRRKNLKSLKINKPDKNTLFQGFGNVNINEEEAVDISTSETYLNDAFVQPCGLVNLTNTCYFNAILQILCNSPLFIEMLNSRFNEGIEWKAYKYNYLLSKIQWLARSQKNDDSFRNDNSDNCLFTILPMHNRLTSAFVDIIRKMRSGGSKVISPFNLLEKVCEKHPMFQGRAQHDSHELLRCILDSLKQDEVRRQRKAILNALNINLNPMISYDDDTKELVKSFGHSANFTTIDSLFGGYLLSLVKCEECQSTSKILEDFFDLMLPVSEEKGKKATSNAQTRGCIKESRRRRKSRTSGIESKKSGKNKGSCAEKESDWTDIEYNVGNSLKNIKLTDLKSEDVNDQFYNNHSNDQTNRCKSKKEMRKLKKSKSLLNGSNKNSLLLKRNNQRDDPLEFLHESTVSEEEQNTINIKNEYNKLSVSDKESDCETNPSDSSRGVSTSNNNIHKIRLKSKNYILSNKFTDDEMRNREADNEEDDELYENESGDDMKMPENLNRIKVPSSNDESEEIIKAKNKWVSSTLCLYNRYDLSGINLYSCLSNFIAPELLAGSNKIICDDCTKRFEEKYKCKKKIYTNASKQILIALPPPLLTIQLKRFESDPRHVFNWKKNEKFVKFPSKLDLSPFISKIYYPLSQVMDIEASADILYDLYGVVNHTGSIKSGHYTAYVKLSKEDKKSGNLEKFLRISPFVGSIEILLENFEEYKFEKKFEIQYEADFEETDEDGVEWYYISDSHVYRINLDEVLNSQAYLLFYKRIN